MGGLSFGPLVLRGDTAPSPALILGNSPKRASRDLAVFHQASRSQGFGDYRTYIEARGRSAREFGARIRFWVRQFIAFPLGPGQRHGFAVVPIRRHDRY